MRGARRSIRGFTLVEILIALTVAGLLAAIALPSWQSQLARVHRQEAVSLLTQLQAEQELFRARHGVYAPQIEMLGSVNSPSPSSAHGGYRLTMALTHDQHYTAQADARVPDRASNDECATLTLRVEEGFAKLGPTPRCWNR